MAVATIWPITNTCGHETNRDLSDKPAGKRAGHAEYLSTIICFDCYRVAVLAEQARTLLDNEIFELKLAEADRAVFANAADQAMAASAEQLTLPKLTGSDKQKTWALTIRYELLHDAYTEFVAVGENDGTWFENKIIAPARLIDKAHWWVDNWDMNVYDLPELLRRRNRRNRHLHRKPRQIWCHALGLQSWPRPRWLLHKQQTANQPE